MLLKKAELSGASDETEGRGWPAVSRKWQLPGKHDTVCSKRGSHSGAKDANSDNSMGKWHWACSKTSVDQPLHTSLAGTSPVRDPRGCSIASPAVQEKIEAHTDNLSLPFAFLAVFSHSAFVWNLQSCLYQDVFKSMFECAIAYMVIAYIIFCNHCVLCLFVQHLCVSLGPANTQAVLYRVI